MRLRFAPSPTGYLHVGNARTALFNWLLARGSGGTLVLRIEDTDVERSSPASEASIFEDLTWLGLSWDEGPDVGGRAGPYRQSQRGHLYTAHVKALVAGGHAYHCFCSREQLERERQAAVAAGRPAVYSGRCQGLTRQESEARIAAGEQAAVRFHVPVNRDVVFRDVLRGDVRFHTDVIGDPIVMRADGTPAYNFAVVVDDALMKITHVIRGEDHISNTPRQVLLYEALGFAQPVFAHLALVLGADHSPLSKRHGATSVAEFRAKGYLPEALVNYLALIGWSPGDDEELLPLEELARRFSLEAVGLSAGVFDEQKLAWVNRHYLRMAAPERLAELSVVHLRNAGLPIAPDATGLEFLASTMSMVSASVDRLEQVAARLSFLFRYSPEDPLSDAGAREEMRAAGPRAVVRCLADELARSPRLDRDRFRAVAAAVREATGQKSRALFHPIRLALTGHADGPELDLAVPAIDRGADLPSHAGIPPIVGCRERAAMFAEAVALV
jgi:glutamyl-tRNA synthetase